MDSSKQSTEDKFNEQLNKMLEDNHPTQLLEGLSLLYKLFDNIGKNPVDQKFRSIKTTNAKLKASVFNLEYIAQILQIAGFQYDVANEAWVLPDSNLFTLLQLINELKSFIDLVQANFESPEAYQKQLELQQRQKQLKKKHESDKKKEDDLKQMADYDKQERKYQEKAKDSVAQQRNFGCQTKTYKDIGVDLNAKGG